MSKRGRPSTTGPVTYKGETKTVAEWSEELGISRDTLRGRLKKQEAGTLTLDECFLPTGNKHSFAKGNTLARNQGAPIGPRSRAMVSTFAAFNKILAPQIEADMELYRDSNGEQLGPSLKFMKEFKHMFPTDKSEALDGEAPKQMAAVAVVVQSQAPTDITILDN